MRAESSDRARRLRDRSRDPGGGLVVGGWLWLLGSPLFSPGCGGAPCSLPFPRTCAPGFGGWFPRAVLPSSRPAPPSLPSLPLPRLAVRGGPPGISAVGSPAAGGVAGDCGPGHYPPLPHAYPGGASCSFTLFKNPRPWVECATVVGVSFLRGPLESLLAGRPAWLPPRW